MTPQQRKEQTERLLATEGIPFNSHLPWVESESETRIRSPREVGVRLLCLFCVVGTAFNPANDSWSRYLDDTGLWEAMSPTERQFVSEPTQSEARQLSWRFEAMFVLMWALRLFDELPLPRDTMDTDAIVERLPALDDPPEDFLQSLTLRSAAELLDASDLIYRLHWAVRDASLSQRPIPGGLQPGIVQEWHYAINWLTCYQDSEWDEVSTDT